MGFCLLSFSGCVERRMLIRSDPPGALVYIDDYENPIGMTPCSTNFTYYGTRKIRLVKDRYETLTVMQQLPSPWYEITPLDFVSENLVPGQIRDQRVLSYQLTPQMVAPTDQLRARAEQLRNSAHAAAGVPPSASGIAPQPTVPATPGTAPPAGGVPVPSGNLAPPANMTPPGNYPPSVGGVPPSSGESISTPQPNSPPMIPPPAPSSGIGGQAVPTLPPR
jgi:hypothetical protein